MSHKTITSSEAGPQFATDRERAYFDTHGTFPPEVGDHETIVQLTGRIDELRAQVNAGRLEDSDTARIGYEIGFLETEVILRQPRATGGDQSG